MFIRLDYNTAKHRRGDNGRLLLIAGPKIAERYKYRTLPQAAKLLGMLFRLIVNEPDIALVVLEIEGE